MSWMQEVPSPSIVGVCGQPGEDNEAARAIEQRCLRHVLSKALRPQDVKLVLLNPTTSLLFHAMKASRRHRWTVVIQFGCADSFVSAYEWFICSGTPDLRLQSALEATDKPVIYV